MNNVSEDNTINSNNEQMGVPSNNLNDNSNDVSTESLTVDYNNLYKLESNPQDNVKQSIDQKDIQFDNADYIQDEDIIRNQEKAQTKHNLLFMTIVFVILVLTILIIFPFIFKMKI